MNNTIQTFTENALEDILSHGGDYDWVVDPNRAKTLKYLVCCHSTGINRGYGFVVGKISYVEHSRTNQIGKKEQKRYKIGISEYAKIDKPDLWSGQQNPVRYTSLEKLGIELSDLKFQKVVKSVSSVLPEVLTIAQAKAGLAKQFGVSEESIEITIKG